MRNKKVRIAAIGDIHMEESIKGSYSHLFNEISEKADILALCGDITQNGLTSEADILIGELRSCKIPVIGVFGNHDFENNKQNEIKRKLYDKGIKILDGETYIFEGVGFAGVKGFCGGFDRHMVASWGENILKKFVYETVNETLKLEKAIAKLETEKKVVLLHYAPIRETVIGEIPEVIPFVGSSRLVEPIDQLQANVVFHGHSHHGSPQGNTIKKIPVFNVALPVLQHHEPKKSYLIFDI